MDVEKYQLQLGKAKKNVYGRRMSRSVIERWRMKIGVNLETREERIYNTARNVTLVV